MSEWPKKMPAGEYAKRWYTKRTKESVINDIKRGNLPGTQEVSGQWFVWVNADQTAAHGYRAPASQSIVKETPPKPSSAGVSLALKILTSQGQAA